MKKRIILKTEDDMRRFAACLSKAAANGRFFALFGGMGAGKTTLIRYLGESLGIDSVASPTFTIVKNYHTENIDIAHFDCYRLSSSDELYALGFEDHLSSGAMIVMEWSENCLDALPSERLEIRIEGSGIDKRTVELIAFGDDYDRTIEDLAL